MTDESTTLEPRWSPPGQWAGRWLLERSIERSLAELLNIASDAQREKRIDKADEIVRLIIAEKPLDDIPLEALCPLTKRIIMSSCNKAVHTIGQLVRCDLSDLRRWKNFGNVSRTILGLRLRALGLNLAKCRDYSWLRPLPARLCEHLVLIPTYAPIDMAVAIRDASVKALPMVRVSMT